MAGFAVVLDGTETKISGTIGCDQPRALDLAARGGKRVERVPVARHFSLCRSRWSLEGGLRLAAGGARSARGISKLPPPAILAEILARLATLVQ